MAHVLVACEVSQAVTIAFLRVGVLPLMVEVKRLPH